MTVKEREGQRPYRLQCRSGGDGGQAAPVANDSGPTAAVDRLRQWPANRRGGLTAAVKRSRQSSPTARSLTMCVDRRVTDVAQGPVTTSIAEGMQKRPLEDGRYREVKALSNPECAATAPQRAHTVDSARNRGKMVKQECDGLQMTSREHDQATAVTGLESTAEPFRCVATSTLWTWGVLLSQSVPWMPLKDLSRSVAVLWLLMSFTLGSVYRSNLKAMIILPRIDLPFSSLDELAESNIDSILVNGSAIHFHIMNSSTSSSLGRLKNKIQLFYVDQLPLAKQMMLRGEGVGLTFKMSILSIMNDLFSTVNLPFLFTSDITVKVNDTTPVD
ncbi:uncharacterized protein LOC135089913 [Scylla paramamosain]|uniref:uncharacterized protein LOC135089913 n=1 Tax=Scylla paramamosain TaxID=85552 RepID=UPI0030833751